MGRFSLIIGNGKNGGESVDDYGKWLRVRFGSVERNPQKRA